MGAEHDVDGGRLPGGFSRFRLLTGPDDRSFCDRVSDALDLGWELYGSPAAACAPDGSLQVAQALLWP